jgi:hypothetical protein
MDKRSVRALKLEAVDSVVKPLIQEDVMRRSLGVSARRLNGPAYPRTIALGIAKGIGRDDFRLAIRVQHPRLMESPEVGRLRELARGEADVRYVGNIRPMQAPWYQSRCRSLRIGCSVGHFNITAGTLGAFVQDVVQGVTYILSNNHVLADENRSHPGDQILQPGKYDNGVLSADTAALLTRFVPLNFRGTNFVDCAIAAVDTSIQFDVNSLDTLGQLSGPRAAPIDIGVAVRKVGRTTGITRGSISVIELDNVAVGYDQGVTDFDSQIEIESADPGLFSDGGDSGSLIVDEDNRGLGLLFAGSDQGGTNSLGLTYANPLETVLTALSAHLIF